jgi:LPS export ABC transporter protein LptC/lipopolysaccharide transport protein LptA
MATTLEPRRLRNRATDLAPEGAGFDAGEGRARLFAAARRHSFLVRTLRVALPTFAIAMLGIYGATTWRITSLRTLGVQLDEVRVSSDHLRMANPTYAGFGKDGSRHSVRARSAETDLLTQKRVKLTAIEGEIIQQTGTRIDLTATRGTFEQESGVLELFEQIDVRSTDGMTAKLTSATVRTKENRVTSNEPVTAQMPTGNIRAQTMEFETKRRLATFTGDVAVRMVPQQTPKPAQTTQPAQSTPSVQPDSAPTARKAKSSSGALGPSFSSNEPVDINSDRLTIDDEKRVAMFRSNVIARQGTSTLAAPELDATYVGRAAMPSAAADAPADQAASRLSTLEARGNIVLTRDTDRVTATSMLYDAQAQRTTLAGPVQMTSGADRRASSAAAEIDHKADRITLEGAVVINQERNVLKGERLAIDRANGRARLESPADAVRAAGRISVLLHRNEQSGSRSKAQAAIEPSGSGDARGLTGGAFRTDPNAPIDIDAATLDFEDARRVATFSGSVVAKQGDFVIRTPTLTAFFSGQSSLLAVPTGKSADASATPASLKKIEARGGVVVTGKDGQKVTGDWADFDPQANFATVGGRVVVNQGKNIVEGSKLILDLTSGRTRFETGGPEIPAKDTASDTSAVPCVAGQNCTSRRRIRAVFYPKDAKKALPISPRSRSEPKPPSSPEPAAGPRSPSQSSWESSTRPAEPGTPR